MPAESCGLHGHSHQPLRLPWAAPTCISCKGAQLTKSICATCTSFILTPSCKEHKLLPRTPRAYQYHVASFMGLLYQTDLIPLVSVLLLCPQTLLCPCPVPRQGPQLCPSLAVYIYPESPQPSVVCSYSHIRQTGTQTLSIVDSVFIYIYVCATIYIYLSLYINHTNPLLCC